MKFEFRDIVGRYIIMETFTAIHELFNNSSDSHHLQHNLFFQESLHCRFPENTRFCHTNY
ncbi:hypothetical protein ACJEEI_07415 [Bacteroides uniformis]|uniref:hypothetical protein n=1 Tax=Bacteroides uniformis TaxID=820 RepID=UPI00397CD8DF